MLSRFKFEIQGLFQEIYDKKLPQTLFMSKTTTFADFQSAGLQAIIPIVNKLRQYGHSDENIRGRVFAFCEDELDFNSVQFDFSDVPVTFDIYKESINMEFNVIVGNPPFLKGVWKKFLEKAVNLSEYVIMISPDNTKTFSTQSKKFNKFLIENGVQDIIECTDYFNVESGNIVCYIINKSKSPNKDVLVLKSDVEKFDIIMNYDGPKIKSTLSNKRMGKHTRAERYDENGPNRIENIESIANDGITTKFIEITNTHVVDLSNYWITNRYFGKNEDAPIFEINQTMGVSSNILLIERIPNLSLLEFKEIYLSEVMRDILSVLRGKSFDTSPRHLKQLPVLTLNQYYSL
jgi:hypothetical protein